MLMRRAALERIGGLARIRGALIDDCALAQATKQTGGNIWLGLTRELHSVRDNRRLADVWHMVARTAFTQLRHSPALLAVTVAGMLVLYLAPPLVLAFSAVFGDRLAGALAAGAWGLMVTAYLPTLRLYGQPWLFAPLLPIAAALYTGMTVDSAWRYWRGSGGQWKGRVAPAAGPAD